jgi:hypothetical protein
VDEQDVGRQSSYFNQLVPFSTGELPGDAAQPGSSPVEKGTN